MIPSDEPADQLARLADLAPAEALELARVELLAIGDGDRDHLQVRGLTFGLLGLLNARLTRNHLRLATSFKRRLRKFANQDSTARYILRVESRKGKEEFLASTR